MESSRYRVVAEGLRSQIRESAPKNGGRLPTEVELSAQYGVSRGTIRRAYLELVGEGLVSRVRGHGSFAVRRDPYRRSFGSVDELLSLSEDTLMEVVRPLETVADPEAAVVLGLQYDEVVRLSYRRLHNEEAFCYTDVVIPPRLLKCLEPIEFLHQPSARSDATVLGILDHVMSSRVSGSRETVRAVAASAEVAGHIGCEEGEPVLRIERVHFAGDQPVERCVNWFNPDRYVYRLHLQRH